MQLFVYYGKTFIIDVNDSDTVLTIKSIINDIEKIPVIYQIIVYNGKVLENDNETLEFYKINDNSTLYLRIRSGNMFKIKS